MTLNVRHPGLGSDEYKFKMHIMKSGKRAFALQVACHTLDYNSRVKALGLYLNVYDAMNTKRVLRSFVGKLD